MDSSKTDPNANKPTPVDDVRRVREIMSREAGNDLRGLAENSRKISETVCEQLGLKMVNSKTGRRG